MMNEARLDALLFILRRCQEAAPSPWYPSLDPEIARGAPTNLDAELDLLRLAGLVGLTDWVQGRGQGYALTPGGAYALEHPAELERVRRGALIVPSPREPLDDGDPRSDRGPTIDRLARERVAPVVTWALIGINVLWFLAGIADAYRLHLPLNDFLYNPPMKVLNDTGILSGESIVKGEWWRLMTSCFVHIGLLHLAANMWSLYALGTIQEGMWGPFRFLTIYLISGLGGACAMVITHPNMAGGGASGAIFGLMSSLAVWLVLNRRHLGGGATVLLRRLMLVFVINVFISTLPQISAAAHFGGAATGLVVAVLLNEERFRRGVVRWLCMLGTIAVPVIWLAAVMEAQKIDERWEGMDFDLVRLPRAQKAEQQANRILEERIPQLQKGAFSLQKVRDANAVFREARAHLDESINLMAAMPYRSKRVEEVRIQDLEYFKSRRNLREAEEYKDFVGALVAETVRQSSRLWTNANPQLRLDAKMRDPETVAQLLAAMKKQQAELASVIEFLKGIGPYQSQKVEEERLEAIKNLERKSTRFAAATDCLRDRTVCKDVLDQPSNSAR